MIKYQSTQPKTGDVNVDHAGVIAVRMLNALGDIAREHENDEERWTVVEAAVGLAAAFKALCHENGIDQESVLAVIRDVRVIEAQ